MSSKGSGNVSNNTFKDREKPQEVRKANILAARGNYNIFPLIATSRF